MGKLTFRRVVTTLKRSLVVALLPIAGGTLFFLGSLQPLRGPIPRAHEGRKIDAPKRGGDRIQHGQAT